MPRWRVTTVVLVPVAASVEVVAEDAEEALRAAEGLESHRWSLDQRVPEHVRDLEIELDDAEVARVDDGEALDGPEGE